MDVMDEALMDFWRKLNDYHVKFIMVGGLATRFHGYNRTTDDLDMWIEDTLENRRNLRKAFVALRYGDFPTIETMRFVPGWTSFHAAGIVLDIMTTMKGLEGMSFDDCYQKAEVANIEDVQVRFLHINHLIQNKKAVNRSKDRVDVEYLEKIKSLLDK
ncbi:hypothetical protein [Agriterribacter sp.]|uniref:hypothetical protein n=1 Tax=Agriterribacter sp. TaxID=2821509 RepID=UPI002D0C894E|nr:hypothetical protein [Agriterribacter sp.]HRO45971.1 hypothetical protein [Agriterribacter sp.]HRQ18962.1 hypothetical protein [Agriterribacter sp.]